MRMRPLWLIEAGVYGAEVQPLLAEIRRQGMAAELMPHSALREGAVPIVDGHPIDNHACVIGYGTFSFARQILLHRQWVPGAWCTQENLDCAAYYAHFGRFLLNQHYTILPGVEAIRQADWLFRVFANAEDDEVFIRPTGCQKLFVGRCVSQSDFRHALSPARYDPQTLVVIAPVHPIQREWRLIIIGDRILSGSQYAQDGSRNILPDLPDAVRDFAQQMLSEVRWRPDPIFMLDICESQDRLWLVEINGFSCSWLYACNLPAVISEVSHLATTTWSNTR